MDVTGQELRDVEIREALRGYARDEVVALLERAAETIEELDSRLRALRARQATPTSHANAGGGERTVSPSPVSVGESARIGKTLLDAQTAADQAITEAQARARQLIVDSEAKAEELIADARSTAHEVADNERRGVEREIVDLAERRDALRAEADTLEVLGANYGDRIRDALATDLERLDHSPAKEAMCAEAPAEDSASVPAGR